MKTDRDRHGSPEGRVPQNRPRGSRFPVVRLAAPVSFGCHFALL